MCESILDFFTDVVIPRFVFVVDDSGSETPSRVDASASDWDGGQVNHEHGKSNWKWSQNLENFQR